MSWVGFYEWSGSLLGLLGAILLALHTKISRYGWIAYLAANLALIAFSISKETYGLLTQQIGFSFASLLGLYRSGLVQESIFKKTSSKNAVIPGESP